MVLERRASSLLLHCLRDTHCQQGQLRLPPQSRSRLSSFHVCKIQMDSITMHRGEPFRSHQPGSRHSSLKNIVRTSRFHDMPDLRHHQSVQMRPAGGILMQFYSQGHGEGHESSCRHQSIQMRPAPGTLMLFHPQGHGEGHESSCRCQSVQMRPAGGILMQFHPEGHNEGHGSSCRHQSVKLTPAGGILIELHPQGHGAGHESSCRILTDNIMRHSSWFTPHRSSHVGSGQFAVRRRTLSCGILYRTSSLQGGILSSPYSSCPVHDEDVPAPEHFQEEASPQSQLDSLLAGPIISKFKREKVSSIINFLNERGLAGYTVVKRAPVILRYSLKTIENKLKFLEGLGIDPQQMSKFLGMANDRTVVGLSLVNLENHVQFLKDIGLQKEDIKDVFLRQPKFLFLNVKRKLYYVLAFYVEIGFDMEAFCGLVRSRPDVFCFSTERLLFEKSQLLQDLPRTEHLKTLEKETMFSNFDSRYTPLLSAGLSKEDLYRMCEIQPMITTLKEDTMKRKIEYLTKVLNRDVKELMKFPGFLTFSLEKRIKPRFEHINQLSKSGILKNSLSLSTVVGCTSSEFERKYVLGCTKANNESS